ncbi:hypothetical protein J6590_053890 [Homalodisca vitripennis]|nr:hypothetical protein J6590_053890 [Homalodisca vitripennis]
MFITSCFPRLRTLFVRSAHVHFWFNRVYDLCNYSEWQHNQCRRGRGVSAEVTFTLAQGQEHITSTF